jgi:hypothetical protein
LEVFSCHKPEPKTIADAGASETENSAYSRQNYTGFLQTQPLLSVFYIGFTADTRKHRRTNVDPKVLAVRTPDFGASREVPESLKRMLDTLQTIKIGV